MTSTFRCFQARLSVQSIALLLGVVSSIFSFSGCDTVLQDMSGTSSDPAASTSPVVSQTPASPPKPQLFKTKVKSNVYGATVTVHTVPAGDEEPEEVVNTKFQKQDQFAEFELPPNQKYTIMLTLAERVAAQSDYQPRQNGEVELNFTNDQFADFHRAGACLLVIPGGGFGSGFLMGDRQTIATAAHCVACENVGELKIVFHPEEPRQTQQTGAQLIYFDAKQDVALLHLKEPMPDYHPYFWTPRAANKEDAVTILGNPGRAGFPDPMYSRSAKVKGTRPDEFFIDIEVKPGYSGGPVILNHTMNAVGITSFKYINTEKYEKDGQSYAKSSDIASDAYTHWSALPEPLKANKLTREKNDMNDRFHFIEADEVSTAIYSDSFSFLLAVIDVIRDYKRHMSVSLSGLPNPVSASVFTREERKAHREYLKEEGPKKAKEIRERISPDLYFERGYQERYDKVIADPDLPKHLKDHLVSANEHFTTIREALENVVDPSGRSSKGKTLVEFIDYIIEEFNSAQFHCRKFSDECRGRTQ